MKIIIKFKVFLKSLFNLFGLDVRRIRDKLNRTEEFSQFDEQKIIKDFLTKLNRYDDFIVDIGAHDGLHLSNTAFLVKNGNAGLAIEYGEKKFFQLAFNYRNSPKVNLCKYKVTPENICLLLSGYKVPKKFGFLNLDIDGYDYFILERILGSFRPSLICTEINNQIPPPLKFTVKYDPDYSWAGDHFQGYSISQLDLLCKKYNYTIVYLEYQNAFLVPEEINIFKPLTPEKAYLEGYVEHKERKNMSPYKDNGSCRGSMEEILKLSPQEASGFVKEFFSVYKNKYTLKL